MFQEKIQARLLENELRSRKRMESHRDIRKSGNEVLQVRDMRDGLRDGLREGLGTSELHGELQGGDLHEVQDIVEEKKKIIKLDSEKKATKTARLEQSISRNTDIIIITK